jgi:hypothetical protein
MARPTLDIPTRDSTSLRAMEMVVTPMAIGIIVETRETTPTVTTKKATLTTMEAMEIIMEAMVTKMEAMDIRMEAMDIRMEAMDNTVLRRICRISSAISARRQDILLICARRRN